MPKLTDEQLAARRGEIVDVCAALYRELSFKEITLQMIGERTSFGRTSIYNYFHSKEEIFLALLQREHEDWIRDLNAIGAGLEAEELADALARSVERRGCMLKLMCMNLYDMESSSRLENLAEFKAVYVRTVQALKDCLRRSYPQLDEAKAQGFINAFFPYLFGLYPFTVTTDKQQAAFDKVGFKAPKLTVFELVSALCLKLLASFKAA